MRAHQQAAALVVVRSEADSGRVGLRLIGELDLNTVVLLEAELSRTREQSPPSVIDLTELRFLDLAGLRALLRAVEGGVAGTARLVGASGIVRRLIELAHTLDADTTDAAPAPFPSEPAQRTGAERLHVVSEPAQQAAVNGSRADLSVAAAITTNGKAQ
jgi:anti-anti-sigma factor